MASRFERFVSTWYVCCGVSAITSKTSRMKSSGTSGWKRSLMELTKMTLGDFQPSGAASVSGCSVSAKPGPLVFGSPSFWYFAWPIARSRFDRVNA